MNSKLLLEGICRNFGGLKYEDFENYIIPVLQKSNINLSDLSININENLFYSEFSSINLIKSNIEQSKYMAQLLNDNNNNNNKKQKKNKNYNINNNVSFDLRHIMMITNTEISWKYLHDLKIVTHNNSEVIFGSKFKSDINSSLILHQNIEKIKKSMINGNIVILLHLTELYDSLYDILNQKYLVVDNKRFSKISIRNETIKIEIHPSFLIIVVVPSIYAYHKDKNEDNHTPVAFLNRFKKYVIDNRSYVEYLYINYPNIPSLIHNFNKMNISNLIINGLLFPYAFLY